MSHQNLIEANDLHTALENPQEKAGLVVLDCRFELTRPAAGREAYVKSHIPGAQYAHLDEDLSSPVTPATGRHPLPAVEKLAARFGAWGVGADTQLVAYDDANSAFAARLWWLARWLGHRKVAVLNGGFKAWVDAGYPVLSAADDSAARPAPTTFVARVQPDFWLDTATIERAMRQNADTRRLTLIDARGADRFAGRNETIDPVAGHVPGALNHPFPNNLDAQQRFLPPDELRARWRQTLGDTAPETVASMCGSGVTACHNLLALELAGLPGAKLYAGSWSEWIRDPDRPVA